MNKIIKQIFILLISISGFSQSLESINDSLFYQKIENDLSILANEHSSFFNNYVEEKFTNDFGTIDLLKRYAFTFDFLLSKNIYLNEKFPQRKVSSQKLEAYIRNKDEKINLDTTRILPSTFNTSNEVLSYYYFRIFCSIKNNYRKKFDGTKTLFIAQEIRNLIKFGNFKYPQTVRDILLHKYDHITEGKYDRDMRSYWKN